MYKLLKRGNLIKFISNLMKKYELIAPVKKHSIHIFQKINNPKQINLDHINTLYPPKEFFMPPLETLFAFKNSKITRIYDQTKRIIFGIRPCDVNALLINDLFLKEDAHYINRRKNTLIMALHCKEPGGNCFCTYSNFDKIPKGKADLIFYEDNNNFLIEIGTEKGEQLTKNLKQTKIQPNKKIKCDSTVSEEQIKKLKANWDHEVWKKNADICLSCTACTTTCPTCLSFNIEDFPKLDFKSGERKREWASCQLKDFTKVAGNHVFREAREKRLKHRIYHKWDYFKDQFNTYMCVGCGRCITNCPTKISMVEMVNEL